MSILSGKTSEEVHVLLVEDDPADALLTREAFETHKIANPLHVVTDGAEALRFLRREDPYKLAPRPALIVLDLNLPGIDGRQVLAEIKADPDLRAIPVVILTTSSAEEDIVRSHDTHANGYITKPMDLEQFMRVVRQLDEFFVTMVRRPTTHRSRATPAG